VKNSKLFAMVYNNPPHLERWELLLGHFQADHQSLETAPSKIATLLFEP